MLTLLIKLTVIALIVWVAMQQPSVAGWSFVAVPLIYLTWRLELRR